MRIARPVVFWVAITLMALSLSGLVWIWFASQPVYVTDDSIDIPIPTISQVSLPSPTTVSSTQAPTMPRKISNPRGEPKSMAITHGEKVVLKMGFAPRVPSGNKFSSQCGKVAWWDKGNSPKPGERSLQKAFITGHMRCSGTYYSIDNLRKSKKGYLLSVVYSSGDVVIAEAYTNVRSIDKGRLNSDEDNTMNGGKMLQEIRVSTCDKESDLRRDGHVEKNLYQLFRVVEVIKH